MTEYFAKNYGMAKDRLLDRLSRKPAPSGKILKKRYVVIDDAGQPLGFSGTKLTFHPQCDPAEFTNAVLVGKLANEVGGMVRQV